MHLIDNIKLKLKFGIIWSDSAHASAVDVPGKPGTSTAKLYIAGSFHIYEEFKHHNIMRGWTIYYYDDVYDRLQS